MYEVCILQVSMYGHFTHWLLTAIVVNAYFVLVINVTTTLLLLLLQTKAHIHTTQVNAPCTCR